MQKLSLDLALAEFEKWLEWKKIRERKRDSNKDAEELILDAIMDGSIVIDEENKMKFTLSFPLESDDGDILLADMTFKPRLRVFEINAKMKGVKSTDVDARIVAYISAASDINSGMIKKLNTEDFNVAQSIIMYFL